MRSRQDKIQKRIKYSNKKVKKFAEILQPSTDEYLEIDVEDGCYDEKKILDKCDIATNLKKLYLKMVGQVKLDYSPNSKFLTLGTSNGLLVAMNWAKKVPLYEINVFDSVKSVKYLHRETMLACACKNLKIYDNIGTELHSISRIHLPLAMDFMSHFMLLVTGSEKGFVSYLDITTGDIVSQIPTRRGRLDTLCSNPTNGVCFTGHSNGTVSLWSPNENKYLAYMMCHEHGGMIGSLHVHPAGHQLATAAQDKRVRIWDLRRLGAEALHEIVLQDQVKQVLFSRTGLLTCGLQRCIQVVDMKEARAYLDFKLPQPFSQMCYCPAEDFLGVGMGNYFENYIIPGASVETFDSFAPNPFESRTMRQEREVKQLINKLPYKWISMEMEYFKKPKPPLEKVVNHSLKRKERADSCLDYLR